MQNRDDVYCCDLQTICMEFVSAVPDKVFHLKDWYRHEDSADTGCLRRRGGHYLVRLCRSGDFPELMSN